MAGKKKEQHTQEAPVITMEEPRMGGPWVTVVVNYKGGVGKSTIAIHLACHDKAAVVDLDNVNHDSSRFAANYGLEHYQMGMAAAEELYDLIEQLKNQGKNVIIDCPPGDTPLTKLAMLCGDIVCCPTRPGPHDIYAVGRINTVLREVVEVRGPMPLLFVCNFYRNTEVANDMIATLKKVEGGEYVGKLWERKEYAQATNRFMPVWESHPDSTGAKEMLNLVSFIEKARKIKRAAHV